MPASVTHHETHIAFIVLVGIITVSAGCSNLTRYTRGPVPKRALPEPEWTMISPPEAVEEFNSGPGVQISGKLSSVRKIESSTGALMITIKDARMGYGAEFPEAVFKLVTWTDRIPDMTVGQPVNVVMSRRYPRELTISDASGPLLRAFAGEVFPPVDDIHPIHMTSTADNAYSEVILSPYLCNQTWIHPKIAVTSNENRVVFRPGTGATISGSCNKKAMEWKVITADNVFMDESSCSEDAPPRAFFVWMRTAITGQAETDLFQKIRK